MRVGASYEHQLQSVYWNISLRGVRVDPEKIEESKRIVNAEIARNLAVCSNQWGTTVFLGAGAAPDDPEEDACNINATQGDYALLKKLKELGYNVPKITKKNEEGDYEQSFSTGELALQKMLSENKFGYPGGDPAIRSILEIRKLEKLKTSYLNARLFRREGDVFFISVYNVAGTVSGRRSSKRHPFGFGNNGQNFPKRNKVAKLYRQCLVSRRGRILLSVDQIQAEDWPVSALSQNYGALQELRSGVDRHSKLATLIFQHRVPSKNDADWNEILYDKERYIGKKGRHANNYGMTEMRFADVLAQEASMSVPISMCKQILQAVDAADPSVKGVFHKYVQDQLSSSRVLITPEPFLRERQFPGLRPNDTNSSAFKEAYSFIPQSTVADNTGYAVLELELAPRPETSLLIQESHDSIVSDVVDSYIDVYESLQRTLLAFARRIRFSNGIEIEIPIEAEVGYSFAETVKIKRFTLEGVKEAMQLLQERNRITNGLQIAVGL